ncbi:hypothetical protein PAXRUDRAFT_835470 [Paxillus rubicundulus Ve08.2h10]|uniref:Uncharacterized protein n=1 Tax=Paxillus rubicundulus Ve08.2h10 TaxID=930991 RepID=A0A0D0BY18_9AGAM|nr:hypothetical protein PAXRUDRAFT_835470 [Paxillus rubicundulus Ve08.2h10]
MDMESSDDMGYANPNVHFQGPDHRFSAPHHAFGHQITIPPNSEVASEGGILSRTHPYYGLPPIIARHRYPSDSLVLPLSPYSELSGVLGTNLSRQGPSGPGLLQHLDSVRYGLHGRHANQEQHVGDTSNNTPFSAPTSHSPAARYRQQQPVSHTTIWAPRHPPTVIQSGSSHQLPPALTSSQGSHDLGLPQSDPLLPSHATRQGTHQVIHPTRSMTHPTDNSSPYPNIKRQSHVNSSETPTHQCGWREADESVCGGSITRATVPRHLVQHGMVKLRSDALVTCRWCPDGTKPMNRESIVRHVLEVHLDIRRTPKSTASANGLRSSPGFC